MRRCVLLLPLFLLSCTCLEITEQNISLNSLASHAVRAPDPKRYCPPLGKILEIDYVAPKSATTIALDLIYGDFSTKRIEHPIKRRVGSITYTLRDEEYEAAKGLIAYRAQILDASGSVLKEWKQQTYVDIIEPEQPL